MSAEEMEGTIFEYYLWTLKALKRECKRRLANGHNLYPSNINYNETSKRYFADILIEDDLPF